jgi:CSLREA domain-containing protein
VHADFIVSTTADDFNDGNCTALRCTLRQAIFAANSHLNDPLHPDTITFASGVGTILLGSPLPNLDDPVVINGTTQTLGSACTTHQLTVQISPALNANFSAPGLALNTSASGSTIRGVSIGGFGPRGTNSFGNPGIRIDGNDNTVECSNIGTDTTGTTARPNGTGIVINGGANNTIRNNVLSGNRFQDLTQAANWGGQGLRIQFASATGNHVVGNLIGTDATGMAALPNQVGVFIQGASGNCITGNVISGNSVPPNPQFVAGAAVILTFYSPTWLSPSTTPPPASTSWPDSNQIENNLIGVAYDGVTRLDGVTPLTGDMPLPNQRGITINSGNNNRIIGNTIAYNDGGALQGWGINIFPANSTMSKPVGNTISRNLIYKNMGTPPTANGRGGFNISNPAGPANISLVTPPDAAGQVTVGVYWRRATPLQPTTFELFASPVCDEWGAGEGKRFVGSFTATADETGRAAASQQFSGLTADDLLTVTATRGDGTTSHFSLCVTSSITITSISPIIAGATDAQVTITGTGFGADTMPSMQDTSGNPLLLDIVSTNYSTGNHDGTEIVTRIPASQHSTPGWSSAIVVSKYSDPDPSHRAWPTTLKLGSSVAQWFTVDAATATSPAVLTVSTGGTEDQSASITATTGSGTGTVGVAGYPSNPAGATNFATTGSFFDVYVTTGSLFPSITIKYCDPAGGNVVFWWTGVVWVAASNQASANGCITVTVDDTTTPSLIQLNGSVVATGKDHTPPTPAPIQAPAANGAGWNNTGVTVSWNWTDSGSGSGIDAANCPASSTSAGEGTITLPATCKDLAGNTGRSSYTVKVDKTLPTIAVESPLDHQVSPVGLAVVFAAVDAESGLAALSATLSDGTSNTAVPIASGTVINTPGAYALTVTATDRAGNQTIVTRGFVLYDPSGGRITGDGKVASPIGACAFTPACVGVAGSAEFGFVARYKEGAAVPSGQVRFKLEFKRPAATSGKNDDDSKKRDDDGKDKIDFRATSFEWLVVDGGVAQLRGVGTVNGSGSYAFVLTAIDGKITGPGNPDQFRIRITTLDGIVVYDNQAGTDQTGDFPTTLAGGSIVIHK